MQTTYEDLTEERRLAFESTLVKTYIFEVDVPQDLDAEQHASMGRFVQALFLPKGRRDTLVSVSPRSENGFFELNLKRGRQEAILYLDTATNRRFWLGFSISNATTLDWWVDALSQTQTAFDTVWLWPSFLESVQARGIPRGFGLDYDYRKFESDDPEKTAYLKMQLWGGSDTDALYKLRSNREFSDKVVLAKVRMKEFAGSDNEDIFALQDLKYQGKFTTRGTSFRVHAATASFVRASYEAKIQQIEDNYTIHWKQSDLGHWKQSDLGHWKQSDLGRLSLEGFAIHFVPQQTEIPVETFCEVALRGTTPFRLFGLTRMVNDYSAVSQVVDLHTGGKFSLEVHPDLISLYLAEGTCGNSVARFYTNLQHTLGASFRVETDSGDSVF